MKGSTMRRAFSMFTAIVVVVLIATVGVFVLNLSGKTVKETTAQFQYEQAVLYAKSFTEFAVLAVTGNDRSVNCLQQIQSDIKTDPSSSVAVDEGNGYRIRVNIAYIGNTSVNLGACDTSHVLSTSVQRPTTPLTIIVDVYVDYKDPDNPDGNWMSVHRRTVQKI